MQASTAPTWISADLAVNRGAALRIAWALGVSIAVHGSLAVLIQARPGGASSMSGRWIVQASIERRPPAAHEPISAPTDSPRRTTSDARHTPGTDDVSSVASSLHETAPTEPRVVATIDRASTQKEAQPHGMEMPFVRDPTYYAVASLDSPPRLLGPPDACYPQGAIGEVTYVLMIDEHGAVDEASVASINPQGLFTGAAVDLCRRLKFAPGVKDGRAVRSRVRFVVGAHPR